MREDGDVRGEIGDERRLGEEMGKERGWGREKGDGEGRGEIGKKS